MSDQETAAKEQYAKAGVDLAELKEEPKEEPKAEEPKPTEETPAEPKVEAKAEPEEEAPSQEPKESRKRSIYDDYKDKKSEAKQNLDRAEKAERERDELQAKLDAVSNASTPQERKDAKDEVADFLSRHKEWDTNAINEFLALARKGYEAKIPDEIVARLNEFHDWKESNAKAIEEAQFNKEFDAAVPAIKEFLPQATDEEMQTVKAELDKLSHTKAFHDKSLDYVAFAHRAQLAALISPKKRGIEKKGRVDSPTVEFDFDPNADYSKLTPEQRAQWDAEYKKLTKSDGLLEDAQGRKLIL